ncbi:type I phosphodiesterase / nucleotide pyrophosphatase domain-containing protein [Ditylenchus destructor]|uniref:Type I phosphodiesterase / nucleotide pyrophosphatase domain-containing protein n=1 Tax=Ditylenchus destructor TaxID=166010 RepID=A0AAD4R166_9BILA|nr:type I phosphodiesterase / nucleotide pyrophosphatase domain-containing protein [Ditylenchus destructor]
MNNINPSYPSPFETHLEIEENGSSDNTPTVGSHGSVQVFLTNVQRRVCLRRCVTSRRFLLSLVIFLFLFASVSFVLLVIVTVKRSRQVEDAAFLNQHISWRDKCERKCAGNFDVPPLLLISMDGFRADYLNRELTPAVSRILNCGSRADYMMPSYPSKTFPNHYSIVTGLFPESHGIVDNYFMDTEMEGKYFSRQMINGNWYKGEPIWNTVAKNGKKSATFFWPGSEVPIQGIQPTYRYTFNSSLPFSKRVDQTPNWDLIFQQQSSTIAAPNEQQTLQVACGYYSFAQPQFTCA